MIKTGTHKYPRIHYQKESWKKLWRKKKNKLMFKAYFLSRAKKKEGERGADRKQVI